MTWMFQQVYSKLNDVFEHQSVKPLVDVGTCSLHPVHNAFHKALDCLPFDIEQFANDIYSWFKLSAARRQDYNAVKLEELTETNRQVFLETI